MKNFDHVFNFVIKNDRVCICLCLTKDYTFPMHSLVALKNVYKCRNSLRGWNVNRYVVDCMRSFVGKIFAKIYK